MNDPQDPDFFMEEEDLDDTYEALRDLNLKESTRELTEEDIVDVIFNLQ